MQMLAIEEYRFLRSEILLRIKLQNIILILLMPALLVTVMASSAFPDRGAELALGYVGAAGMGALYWIHSAARTVQIKTFLRKAEADMAAGAMWETWLADNPIRGVLGSRWFISTKGVFVGSQIAAIVLCGIIVEDGDGDPLVLGAAAAAAAFTAILLVQPKMKA